MSKIYESGENYLESILMIQNEKGCVRSVDIARELDVSKPSVSRAVNILKSGGFIIVDENGYITLTADGYEIADKIYERRVLTDWLVGIGVDRKNAADDACKLEHDISAEAFDKLKTHIREKHNVTEDV